MTNNKIVKDKKVIGNYKAKFKTSFDKENNDYIFLNISLSEDLRRLIKGVIVEDEKTIFSYYNGSEDNSYTRYLVKKWVYGALYGGYRDFLFEKKLIDKNELKVKILEVKQIDSLISDFKENFRRLIEVVLKYSKVDINVSFNPSKREE